MNNITKGTLAHNLVQKASDDIREMEMNENQRYQNNEQIAIKFEQK